MGEADARTITVRARIRDIAADQWDACANPDPSRHNPFISHAFLKTLEESGAVGERTGWLPQHLTIEDGPGTIGAAMPLYLKLHSQGEYIFDHSWADAFHRAGGSYYPKLQSAVPFTPVPGPRLLVRPGAGRDTRQALLAQAAITLAQRLDASSVHITFLSEGEWGLLPRLGFLQRTGQQFHWHNPGYASFDDFLGELASRKRKMIRKERSEALCGGITIEALSGRQISQAHWDAMYGFYMDTGSRKWGRPYLNRAFFSALGAAMGEQCLLLLARRGGQFIAGALHIIGGDCLYGRYWGAAEHHPFLHFELCYYQAMDYAIAHRLERVEAGAQGEHKLARGYLPRTTYSAHWIANESFRAAVARYLEAERQDVSQTIEVLTSYGPFRTTLHDETD